MPLPPIRVLVADDHAGMVAALVSVLEDDGRFDVVGTAATGSQALEAARTGSVDVVLLDVNMPGGGPEAAAALTALADPPVVVALSAHAGGATVAAMVRAGVVGYLTKGHVGDDLGDLVVRCVDGEVVLATPKAAAALRALVASQDARRVPGGGAPGLVAQEAPDSTVA